MGFGRTDRERQLAMIANSRYGEELLVNENMMVRTDKIPEYHAPSQNMVYFFSLEGFDKCEIYIRVEFLENDGNLSLPFDRRTIERYIDGQIVYYMRREQHGEEVRSVRGIN
jgi:hypothetical protein